jgi:ribosomal protein S27E
VAVLDLSDLLAERPRPRPLVRCSSCGSDLIYPVRWLPDADVAMVDCRCPECENQEAVILNPLVAALWRRRCLRASRELATLAASLSDETANSDERRGR